MKNSGATTTNGDNNYLDGADVTDAFGAASGFRLLDVERSGEVLAALDAHGEIHLFDLQTGKLLDTLRFCAEAHVSALRFSAAGELFAGAWDRTVRICACFTPEKPVKTVDFEAEVTALEIGPEGEILVLLGDGGVHTLRGER